MIKVVLKTKYYVIMIKRSVTKSFFVYYKSLYMAVLCRFKNIINQNKKTFVFGIVGITCLTAAAVYHSRKHDFQFDHSLWNVLDYYGFNEPQQKQSLELIMKKAGIIKPNETFMSLFPKRDNSDQLFQDVLHFVELTQKHFTIRSGAQERWEVQPTAWMIDNKDEILLALENLNITNSVTPTFLNPDLTGVLGARMTAMVSRFRYLDELCNSQLKIKFLALVTGERKVTIGGKGIDGNEEELAKIANKYNMTIDQLTETQLMLEAYHGSVIGSKLPKENLIVIDTPARDLPRPTTETTIQELCNWLREHKNDVHSIIFISNQPHVKYQEAIIKEVFKQQGLSTKFEVVGYKIGEKNVIKIQELVGALGSQIWAQTPELISQAKIHTNNQHLKDQFMELYKKQPLIYNNIKLLLSDNNGKEHHRNIPKPS